MEDIQTLWGKNELGRLEFSPFECKDIVLNFRSFSALVFSKEDCTVFFQVSS